MTHTPPHPNAGVHGLAEVWRIGVRGTLVLAFLVAGGAFSLQISGLDPRAPVGADSASIRSQIALGLAFVTIALFAAGARNRILSLARANMILLALPLLAIVSTAWAPEPAVALRRALAFAGSVLTGLAITAYLPGEKALRFLVQAAGAAMALSLVYIVISPGYALHQFNDGVQSIHAGDWRGVFIHRTALGRLAALSLAMAIYAGGDVFAFIGLRIGVILASLLCLIMAHSSGGYASAAILLLTPWAAKALDQAVRRNRLLALNVAAASGLLAALLTPVLMPLTLQAFGKDLTLTGRTDFWGLMLQAAAERPLLGYGYSTGFRDVVAKLVTAHSAYGFVPNAQNGYLDVVLNLGLIGLAIAVAVMAVAFRRAIRLSVRPGIAILPLLIVVFIAETNVVEAALISANDIFVLIYVTALVASGDLLRTSPRTDPRPPHEPRRPPAPGTIR